MLREMANSKPGEGKVQLEPEHLCLYEVKKCSKNDGERPKGHRNQPHKLGWVGPTFIPASPRSSREGKREPECRQKSNEAREGELMW